MKKFKKFFGVFFWLIFFSSSYVTRLTLVKSCGALTVVHKAYLTFSPYDWYCCFCSLPPCHAADAGYVHVASVGLLLSALLTNSCGS